MSNRKIRKGLLSLIVDAKNSFDEDIFIQMMNTKVKELRGKDMTTMEKALAAAIIADLEDVCSEKGYKKGSPEMDHILGGGLVALGHVFIAAKTLGLRIHKGTMIVDDRPAIEKDIGITQRHKEIEEMHSLFHSFSAEEEIAFAKAFTTAYGKMGENLELKSALRTIRDLELSLTVGNQNETYQLRRNLRGDIAVLMHKERWDTIALLIRGMETPRLSGNTVFNWLRCCRYILE